MSLLQTKKFLWIKKSTICREDNVPYLVRYSLFSCKWFAVKIHHILISDYDCLHDHPWSFISLILKGSYIEETPGSCNRIGNNQREYKAGSLLFRPAKWKHRLVLTKPAWTLVVTFRKQRTWGFWAKKGWVKWTHYNHRESC